MAQMTEAQIDAFLAPPRHAIVATHRADGPPQVTPVWYVYENRQIYISAGAGTVKVQNLRRDPRVTICVDGGHPDARYVILQGTVTILEPHDPLQEQMRWQIIRHYHASEDEARRYYDSMRDFVSVLIVLTPEKISSQDFT